MTELVAAGWNKAASSSLSPSEYVRTPEISGWSSQFAYKSTAFWYIGFNQLQRSLSYAQI